MAKRKSITVSPVATSVVKRKAERTIARALKAQFKATRKACVPKLVEAYKRVVEVHRKGLSDETQYILKELDLTDWVKLTDALAGALGTAAENAAKKALSELGMNEADLFNKVSTEVVSAANNRAAAMVGMKWDGDELVANPSAEYAITETTREGIKAKVVSALTDGMTVEELAKDLEASYMFSDVRAEVISRTEVGRAHVDGTVEAWKQSGAVTGKRSLVGTGEVCEVCGDIEDEGVIDLEDTFSDGSFAPPYHPNCRCVLVSSLKSEDEE